MLHTTHRTRLLACPALLLLVFLLPLFLAGTAAAKPKQVVIIRYRIEPTFFATVVKGFKDRMTLRGYIEGQNVEYVDILTRSASKDSIPDVINAVENYKDSADMIITCGWISMKTREMLQNTGVPQLFVPVLQSVALEMLQSVSAPPNTNLSGLYLMYPPEKILRLSKLIIPKISDYAYVYDSRIPADLVFKKAYEVLDEANRHGIALHYLDLADGVDTVLQELRQRKINAFGGIVGSFQNRKDLAASGIPVITSFTLDIDRKSLKQYSDEDYTVAGLFNPFDYCGEQAAEMTADIFDGKRTIEETIPRPAMQIAFINLQNAKRLSLPITFDALEAVDIILK